jgi:hypothetical protein
MENLRIQKTKKTPEIKFNQNGEFLIKGRLIAEDSTLIFNPIFEWIETFDCSRINFTIDLDYLNTSASMLLYTLIEKLEHNEKIESLHINWYYEEDDEDHLETGEYYAENLEKAEFKFYEVPEDRVAA